MTFLLLKTMLFAGTRAGSSATEGGSTGGT